jgi:hypothetical protein
MELRQRMLVTHRQMRRNTLASSCRQVTAPRRPEYSPDQAHHARSPVILVMDGTAVTATFADRACLGLACVPCVAFSQTGVPDRVQVIGFVQDDGAVLAGVRGEGSA